MVVSACRQFRNWFGTKSQGLVNDSWQWGACNSAKEPILPYELCRVIVFSSIAPGKGDALRPEGPRTVNPSLLLTGVGSYPSAVCIGVTPGWVVTPSRYEST